MSIDLKLVKLGIETYKLLYLDNKLIKLLIINNNKTFCK